MKNERLSQDIMTSQDVHASQKAMPKFFDVDEISRIARVDEKKGKAMWDLLFKAIHESNKAQVEKEFPTRKSPF